MPPFAAGTTLNVAVGQPPAPPPSTKSPEGNNAEVCSFVVELKHGIPPDVMVPETVIGKTELPPLIVLQPNKRVDVFQVRALEPPEHDGNAATVGTLIVHQLIGLPAS